MADNEIQASPQVLANAADGINKIIGELQSMGVAASGDIGRGFSLLELTGLQIGPDTIKNSFDGFCSRWSWGVRSLVRDSNSIAKDLGLAAGAYHDEEQFNADAFKRWENDLVGDPTLSASQVSNMSYAQIAEGGAEYENPTNVDYSVSSFKTAAVNSGKSVASAFEQSWTVRAMSGENPVTGKAY